MNSTLIRRLRFSERIGEILKDNPDELYIAVKNRISHLSSVDPEDTPYDMWFQQFSNDISKHFSETYILQIQEDLMREYEENPVLDDAIKDKISVEDSLLELGVVNKGIRKVLPRRKNKAHNERLEYLGELIEEPTQLRANGIFWPDNFVTTAAYTTIAISAICYFGAEPFIRNLYVNPDPASLARDIKDYQTIIPLTYSAIAAPMLGIGTNLGRFHSLPTKQAKYIDKKVNQLHK